MIGIALLTMFVPVLFFSQPLEVWFYRGLVLLVISCPCALVISTPVSVVSAISGAAGHGVLFKGGTSLEGLGKINVICFDKTGTLTQGQPRVEEYDTSQRAHGEGGGLRWLPRRRTAPSIIWAEHWSKRPRKKNIQIEETGSFESHSGMGISVVIHEKRIIAGSPRFFKKMGMDLAPYEEHIERSGKEGRTVILVGTEEELMGIVAIRTRRTRRQRGRSRTGVDGRGRRHAHRGRPSGRQADGRRAGHRRVSTPGCSPRTRSG